MQKRAKLIFIKIIKLNLIQTLEDIKRDFSKQIFLKAVIDNETTIVVGSVRAYQQKDTFFIGHWQLDPTIKIKT